MKKTIFLIMAVLAMGLTACNGECSRSTTADSLDSVDSTCVDSVDSVACDSVK